MFIKTCFGWLIVAFLVGVMSHWLAVTLINKAKAAEAARAEERKRRLRDLAMRRILIKRARRRREEKAKLQHDRTDDTPS